MDRPPLDGFTCPITYDIMETPMVGPDGHSYERGAIEQALQRNPTSPMTRQPMTVGSLVNNFALRDAIMSWRSEQPMAIDPDRLTLAAPKEVIGRGSFGEVSTNAGRGSGVTAPLPMHVPGRFTSDGRLCNAPSVKVT